MTHNKTQGIILLSWWLVTVILGLSYRFEFLSTIISIKWHPQITLISTPLILIFHWIITKNKLNKIDPQDKVQLRNIQSNLYVLILLGSLTYLIGLTSQMGFLPFLYHQILAVIFSITLVKQSISLIFDRS